MDRLDANLNLFEFETRPPRHGNFILPIGRFFVGILSLVLEIITKHGSGAYAL
jgi:hypothetical protein